MTWTDEELVAKSIGGDADSFNELVLRWERPIYALAYRTIGREEDARDVCQETFLRAFRARPGHAGITVMSDMCSYPNRDGALIAYVYDELEGGDRASFDAHLSTCPACRDEVRALGGVRQQLARWSPPEPAFVIGASATSVA